MFKVPSGNVKSECRKFTVKIYEQVVVVVALMFSSGDVEFSLLTGNLSIYVLYSGVACVEK